MTAEAIWYFTGFISAFTGMIVGFVLAGPYVARRARRPARRKRRFSCEVVALTMGGPDAEENSLAARALLDAWERIREGKEER